MNQIDYRFKSLYLFVCVIFSFSLFVLGGLLNAFAIGLNNGKMPVYDFYVGKSNTHFTFHEWNEIRRPILADIFRIGDVFIFSIGDFIMFIAAILMIIQTVRLVKLKRKYENLQKRS